jgi:hypothetical protein
MQMDITRLQNAADEVAFSKQRQLAKAEICKDYKRVRREVVRYFHLVEKVD